MSLIDSVPGNLDSAVQCKRMMMLREPRGSGIGVVWECLEVLVGLSELGV